MYVCMLAKNIHVYMCVYKSVCLSDLSETDIGFKELVHMIVGLTVQNMWKAIKLEILAGAENAILILKAEEEFLPLWRPYCFLLELSADR